MENKYHYSGFNPKISYEDTNGKYQESFTMMKKVWNVNDSEGLLRVMKVNKWIEPRKEKDSKGFRNMIVEPYGIKQYLMEKVKSQYENMKKYHGLGRRDVTFSSGKKSDKRTWVVKKIDK